MRTRGEFITLLGGAGAWPVAAQVNQGSWIRTITVQVIASVVLLQTWTIAGADTAAVPSDYTFVDELVSDLGFQPSDLIARVRYLANIPSEATMQHRLSYCVQGYADRIATDAKLREKVVSEVEERPCAQLGLCQERGQQRTDQSLLYAELLHVLAGEMRGEKRAWQQEPIRPVIGLCRRSPRHRPLAAEGWCSGLGEQSTKWRAK